jgi:predicted regulator of Ras-like GTPase activity (Roadblock/LC7/MglB family)
MLKQILSEFLSVNGVAAAALIGRDGFVIEIVWVDPLDSDALGVHCSGQMKFFERKGRELRMGLPRQIVQEYRDGTLLIFPVTWDEFLVVLTTTNSGLNQLADTLPKISERIAAVI